jgi:nucleoside-diphosphate-sugar epimerase
MDIPELRGDNSRLREATGWQPAIPMEQTVKDVLDYWRAQIASAT